MKNNLAKMFQAHYEKGCRHGWNSFVMAFFIAIYNVNVTEEENEESKYIKDGKMTEFCSAVENELIRIFAEDMHRNPDAVELLTGTAIAVREKLGLDPEPQLWDAAEGKLKKDEDGRLI